jgi:murein L,D-transpeptidase YafK
VIYATGLPAPVPTAVLVFALLIFPLSVVAELKADRVLVDKSDSRLYLINDDSIFASYRVKFGKNPKGHKQRLGDGRTPEGQYTLDYKNSASAFYKSIHISYPNAEDRRKARQRGVDPGGDIMIHGQANGMEWLTTISQLFNWTDGCIALSNRNMDRVWDAVDAGTPIEIRP